MKTPSIKKRQIKSFIKRQRRLSPRQKNVFAHYWDQFGISVSNEILDLNMVFGRSAKRVLEIGFGNGDSLCKMAKANPQLDYLGVEVHEPGVAALMLQMVENDVENIRVIQGDVVRILRDQIPDNAFSRTQIFFPDPWPKKKHHKRRLIQSEFVQLLRQKMRDNGVLHCATDWEDYAKQMMRVLSDAPGFLNQMSEGQFADNANQALRPNTKFEQRGVRLGHDVWDLLFQKKT